MDGVSRFVLVLFLSIRFGGRFQWNGTEDRFKLSHFRYLLILSRGIWPRLVTKPEAGRRQDPQAAAVLGMAQMPAITQNSRSCQILWRRPRRGSREHRTVMMYQLDMSTAAVDHVISASANCTKTF